MVSTLDFESSDPSSNLGRTLFIYLFMYFFVLGQSKRLRGATVARLTPDQKAACSNHVGVIIILFDIELKKMESIDFYLLRC